MGDSNDDSSSESETSLDRFLDTLLGEAVKWLAAAILGFAGFQLGRLAEPTWLGSATAVLLFVSLVLARKSRVLTRRLDLLSRKRALPAPAPAPQIQAPYRSAETPDHGMGEPAFSILCMIVEAYNKDCFLKRQDFQKRLHLDKAEADLALFRLEEDGYVWEEDDSSLENDPGAFHPMPKGLSYVTSRRADA